MKLYYKIMKTVVRVVLTIAVFIGTYFFMWARFRL